MLRHLFVSLILVLILSLFTLANSSSVGPLITPDTVPSLVFREGVFGYGDNIINGRMQVLASKDKQGIVYFYSPNSIYPNISSNYTVTTGWQIKKQYITEGWKNAGGWFLPKPKITGPSANVCNMFVLNTNETGLYMVCGPNVIAVRTWDGEVMWTTTLTSNQPLLKKNGTSSTTNTYTPDLQGLTVMERMVGSVWQDIIAVYGNGAMWTLDDEGEQLLNQFGPMNTGLLLPNEGLIQLEVIAWNLTGSGGTLLGGCANNDSKIGSFELTLPTTTTGAQNWLLTKTGPIHKLDADTNLSLLVSTPSTVVIRGRTMTTGIGSTALTTGAIICQRATLTCINNNNNNNNDTDTSYYPDTFRTASLISSTDGKYILPSVIYNSTIFILNTETQQLTPSPDGIIVVTRDNSLGSTQSLLLDGENLYLTANRYLIVLNFTALLNGTIEPLWSFNYAEAKDSHDVTTYPPILQNLMGNALLTLVPDGVVNSTSYNLVIASMEQNSLTSDKTTYLTVFTSVKAPKCSSLVDGVNDNCGTCDGVTTGIITARSCAYCSESSLCTGYLFSSHAAPGEICSDSGFPSSYDDACHGKSGDHTVAIVVGCVVGGVILLALVICYLARRRRKSALEAAIDQGQAPRGTYQSM